MSQTKLIETKRVFDLGDHERVELAIQTAPEPGEDCGTIMDSSIDKMEAAAKRKYGASILRKKKEEVL
jgi:hypothetical protein